jgi:hypothetical protein
MLKIFKKMTGIDVFEIAFAFNPVNKKKFFTVKDGAAKPPVTPVVPVEPVTEPVTKDVPVPTEPVTPAVVATPAVPVTDPPAPIVEPAAIPVSAPVTDPLIPGPTEVSKDGEQFKSFKDTMENMNKTILALSDQVGVITTTLKDASILPTVDPDKSAIVKDGKIENDMFLP